MQRILIGWFLGSVVVCVLADCTSAPSSDPSLGDQAALSRESSDVGESGMQNESGAVGETSDDAWAAPVSDAEVQALPDSGFCSVVRGPLSASEADASDAFVCPHPGLCTLAPEPPPPPPPPGGDEVAFSGGPFKCVFRVDSGTVIILGDD
jgi:hypothetical protein